jgi:hypothetical protein
MDGRRSACWFRQNGLNMDVEVGTSQAGGSPGVARTDIREVAEAAECRYANLKYFRGQAEINSVPVDISRTDIPATSATDLDAGHQGLKVYDANGEG